MLDLARGRPTKDLGTMEADRGAMREADKVQCTQHEGSGMRDADESWLDVGRQRWLEVDEGGVRKTNLMSC